MTGLALWMATSECRGRLEKGDGVDIWEMGELEGRLRLAL
jgi:hypothetical protein